MENIKKTEIDEITEIDETTEKKNKKGRPKKNENKPKTPPTRGNHWYTYDIINAKLDLNFSIAWLKTIDLNNLNDEAMETLKVILDNLKNGAKVTINLNK